MNEILDHWIFLEPDKYLDILSCLDNLPKEWINIFYIARCLFANQSKYPIKNQLKHILERKKVFPDEDTNKELKRNNELINFSISDSIDVGKITSMQQISYILPREFLINTEEIFYKKLANRELHKKEFVDIDGLSVSELVYGKEKELNRRQKVYILFDNSSSMNGDKLNKLYAAKAICLKYLQEVRKESPQLHFRYFNNEIGPLFKINKQKQIKDLIRYIINLNTFECYETRIGDALIKAIIDIKSDPELKQAEILMITDGLGNVPRDIKERLGKIKFHMVLISDINTDRFLKVFPNKEAWEQELYKLYNKFNTNKEEALQQLYFQFGAKDMTTFRETFSKLPQLYKLQEIADIFIKIDSLFGERFKFTNEYELDQIRDLRLSMTKKIEGHLSNKEKYIIFQRIKFLIKYLDSALSREPLKELKSRIQKEINAFESLLKKFKEDEWFTTELDISNYKKYKFFKNKESNLKHDSKKSNISWIVVLFMYLLQNLLTIHKKIANLLYSIIKGIKIRLSAYKRGLKLKRKLNYIDNKIFQILTR